MFHVNLLKCCFDYDNLKSFKELKLFENLICQVIQLLLLNLHAPNFCECFAVGRTGAVGSFLSSCNKHKAFNSKVIFWRCLAIIHRSKRFQL